MMQPHPSPSAHACTTLPPGTLPMRDVFNNRYPHEEMHLVSAYGEITRCMWPPYSAVATERIGYWSACEQRTDSAGQLWIKQQSGTYYVVDNFGDLVPVAGEGGAA